MQPKDITTMDTLVLQLTERPSARELATIEKFSKITQRDGCYLSFTEYNGKPLLTLAINYETAGNSRGAGRYRKLVAEEFRRITVGEVRKMLEEKTANEVAADLGVSRSTLFRRLKGKEDGRRF